MKTLLRPALVTFLLLTVITGFAYPLVVFGVAQVLFHSQANGSMVLRDGHPIGSRLIGQPFSSAGYFWGRPSATSPMPYNALASGGSNLGPSNPALVDAVNTRLDALRAADPDVRGPAPNELVTASASGLDPDISPRAAQWQAQRVAKARGLPVATVAALIDADTRGPTLGVFGEPRVNVLAINLALDAIQSHSTQ